MTRLLTLTIVALAATLLFAGAASAKGPFKAELSGGNLDEPLLLEQEFPPDAMNSADVKAPTSLPDETYTLRLMFTEGNGEPVDAFITATYIPAHDGNPPLLRHSDGLYTSGSPRLSTALDASLSEQLAATIEEDGGTTVAWWAIPGALGLGLALLGGGVAGSRLLKRRETAAA